MNGRSLASLSYLCSALLLAACTGADSEESNRNGGGLPPAPVVVAPVEARTFSDTVSAVGSARAAESTLITARVSGMVERIGFTEGGRVSEGDTLIELDAAEERASVDAARAAFEQAQTRHERLQSLAQRNLASRDALDEQNERLKTARADLALAQARLDQRRIRAPFSGVVGLREISPGALITPGTRIVTLDDIRTIRADFSVPEVQLRFLQPGNTVTADAAAWPGREFEGKVRTIDGRVNPGTRAIRVEAVFDNENGVLKPGMLLTIRAEASPRETLFVPEAALTPIGDQQFVWRLDGDERVERTAVRLGSRVPGMVEIRDGLSSGDRVVIEGTANLRPDRPVRIIDRAPAGER